MTSETLGQINELQHTKAKTREDITERLTDTQYYCEKCEQVFEYRYVDQDGCERCNAAIGDNNIAEVVW